MIRISITTGALVGEASFPSCRWHQGARESRPSGENDARRDKQLRSRATALDGSGNVHNCQPRSLLINRTNRYPWKRRKLLSLEIVVFCVNLGSSCISAPIESRALSRIKKLNFPLFLHCIQVVCYSRGSKPADSCVKAWLLFACHDAAECTHG